MVSAITFLKDRFGLEVPTKEIPGSWFIENDLPMIVSCACCGSTMALPNAMIDDDGYTYCVSCGWD